MYNITGFPYLYITNNMKIAVKTFLILFFVIISTGYAEVHAADSVTGYRFKNDKKGEYKFVLDLQGAADYRHFTLKDPHRLVVDIDNVKWKVQDRPVLHPVATKVRHGSPKPGKLRVVVDLNQAVDITDAYFITPNKQFSGHHLVVKFAAKGRGAENPLASRKTQGNSDLPASMQYKYQSNSPFKVPTFKPLELKGYGDSSAFTQYESPDDGAETAEVVSKPRSRRKPVIVLDPGHGGIDPGAIGKSGTKEKDITLQYAHTLRKILEDTGRYRVKMTRSRDRYINLGNRVKKARQYKADLFISIHADSHPNPKTRGLSVYTISEKRSEYEAKKLLRKAHKEEVLRDVNLKDDSKDAREVLIDLARRQNKNKSAIFAETLVGELGDDAKLLRKTHRFAGFAVLTGADVPSVLLELGYMSNRHEEKLLKTEQHRHKLTRGIRDAVDKFFRKHPLE